MRETQPPAEAERASSEPCAHAAPLLAKLGRWSARQFSESLKPVGLKPRHLATLLELRAGPLTQQTLGDAVGTDPAQLVGLLNDLESEELVVRRRDPDDRRRHIVELSSQGSARLEIADRAMADIDARLLAGLTPPERTEFSRLLKFVAENGGFDEECPSAVAGSDESGDACEDSASAH